jgi:superfamily I DNA/RNA helicase
MLADSELMPAGEHVVLATLFRSKGLEAPRVILAGMQESPARFPGGSEEDKALWLRKERLLQYVGMTRARDWCATTRVDAGKHRSPATT